MATTPAKAKNLPGGFPNFKRHLAAIHRLPPTHAPVRPFHVSDVVYSMLRSGGVGKQALRRAGSAVSSDMSTQNKAAKMPSGSNKFWSKTLKKQY
jgi:hypothetical protein